jgi:hypothetical protein
MSPCKALSFLAKPCIKFYAPCFNPKAQQRRHYECEAIAGHEGTQSIHEPRQNSLFRVVIAISRQHGARHDAQFWRLGTGIAAARLPMWCVSAPPSSLARPG